MNKEYVDILKTFEELKAGAKRKQKEQTVDYKVGFYTGKVQAYEIICDILDVHFKGIENEQQ